MKIINFDSYSKKKNNNDESINNKNQGITKRLLEKYKPKVVCGTERIGDSFE